MDYPGGADLVGTRKPPRLFAEPRGGVNYNHPLPNNAPALTDIVSDDAVILDTQYSTQWDALVHVGSRFDPDGDGESKFVYYSGYRANIDLQGPAGDHGPQPMHSESKIWR